MILARSAEFRVEAAEVVHGAHWKASEGKVLQVHHDDVVHLERAGQRQIGPCLVLSVTGSSLQPIVADVFDAGFEPGGRGCRTST